MKRILTFVLALSMALSLAACGSKNDDNKKKSDEQNRQKEQPANRQMGNKRV